MTAKSSEYVIAPYAIGFRCTEEWLDDIKTIGVKTVFERLEAEQRWWVEQNRRVLEEAVFGDYETKETDNEEN